MAHKNLEKATGGGSLNSFRWHRHFFTARTVGCTAGTTFTSMRRKKRVFCADMRVDLNPARAAICDTLAKPDHTNIQRRLRERERSTEKIPRPGKKLPDCTHTGDIRKLQCLKFGKSELAAPPEESTF